MLQRSLLQAAIISSMAVILTACPPSEHHRKVLDTSFLKLGKPGESKSKSDIPKAEHLVVLEGEQKIKFVDDAGLVEVSGLTKNLEKGQILVGNTTSQSLLEVMEVVEQGTATKPAKVKTRLAKVSQLSKDKEASFSYEVTPKIVEEDSELQTVGSYKVNSEDGALELEDIEFYSFTATKEGKLTQKGLKVMGGLAKQQEFKVNKLSQGEFKAVIKKGRVELTPTFRTNAKFNWGKPQKVESRIDALMKYKFEIEYTFSGAGNFSVISDLLPGKKIPIRIPGAVPVYLDVEIKIPAGIKFNSHAAGTFSIRYEGSYSFATHLTYDPKTGLNKVVHQDYTTDDMVVHRPRSEASVSAEFYLEPKITTRLYRVLGPYAYLHPYLKGKVEFPLKKKQDELYMGITGGVGLQVSEPVFQSTLLDLNSGPLFDVYRSWDLVEPSPVANKKADVKATLANKKAESFRIGSITPEGFVVIHLKDETDSRLINFRIIERPTRGILVLADNFTSTGKVYYYPLSKDLNQLEDGFTYYISDGKEVGEPQRIALNLTKGLVTELQQPRFALTNNSVNMSFTGPAENEGKVQHFQVGGEIQATVAVAYREPEQEELMRRYHVEISPVRQFHPINTNRTIEFKGKPCQLKVFLTGLRFLPLPEGAFAKFGMEYRACGEVVTDLNKYGLEPLKIDRGQMPPNEFYSEILNMMTEFQIEAQADLRGEGNFKSNPKLRQSAQSVAAEVARVFAPTEGTEIVGFEYGKPIILELENKDYFLGEDCCEFKLHAPNYKGPRPPEQLSEGFFRAWFSRNGKANSIDQGATSKDPQTNGGGVQENP